MDDRLALIVANSKFDDPKLRRLKTPIRDAEALAEVLEDPAIGNFHVTLLIDKEQREIRREIARLFARRRRSDLLLLYYSGHGIRDVHGDLYLATRDTEMDIASATALSASFVREQLDKSGSQRKVVVLDCCHSGAFAKAGLGDSVGTGDAFAGSGYGRVILTASDALELSWEGDEWLGEGRPSVFTNFLVEGLSTGAADLDGDGEIALDELYEYVYERVLNSGDAKQTPHKFLEVEGTIFIAHSPVARPAELPEELLAAIESPFASVRKDAVDELCRLLHGSHRGRALAAREKLQRLSDDDSRQVSASARECLEAYAGAGRPEQRETSDSTIDGTEEPTSQTRGEEPASVYDRLRRWWIGLPTWGRIVGGAALVLILVGLLSQKCGLWPKPETPTETLPAVTPQEPTATFTIQPTPTSTFPPTPTATPRPGDTWTRPTDGMVMVYVPAGEFALGSDDDDVEDVFQLCTQYRHNCQRAWFEDEQPVRRVALDAFWIDQTEVTNAQFAAFVDDTGYETDAEREGWGRVWTGSRWEQVAGADWQHPEGPDSSAHDDHPVVQVSWNDAVAYCEWAGARLPTEAEWEKAARGTDGRLWPWGSKWDPDRCNSREDGFGRTTPVEQYSPIGDSPYGAADMAGNVWEWCSSLYEPYPYDPSDGRENPEAEGSRVLRGGSWISFPDPLHSAFRDKEQPDFRRDNYGFRCVRDSD